MLKSQQDPTPLKSENSSEVSADEQNEINVNVGSIQSLSYVPPQTNKGRRNYNRQQILTLQRSIGNQAVLRLLGKPTVYHDKAAQRSPNPEITRGAETLVLPFARRGDETALRPAAGIIQRVMNEQEFTAGLSQNKRKLVNKHDLKQHFLDNLSFGDLTKWNIMENAAFENDILLPMKPKSAGVTTPAQTTTTPKATGTPPPKKDVTTKAPAKVPAKGKGAAKNKVEAIDDWDLLDPVKAAKREKEEADAKLLAIKKKEDEKLAREAKNASQVRKAKLSKEAEAKAPDLLKQIDGEVVKISEAATAIFGLIPPVEDPQTILTNGESLRKQLGDGKTLAVEFTDLACTWQVHIDAADIVLGYATSLIKKIGEITELRKKAKEKEAEFNSLQAEAGNFDAYKKTLELSQQEVTRAEEDQAKAQKLTSTSVKAVPESGDEEISPVVIHTGIEEVLKKADERLAEARTKVKTNQAQYDKALAAQTSLQGGGPQKELAGAVKEEKEKTVSGTQDAAKVKSDIEINQQLRDLAGGQEKLKYFRSMVSDDRELFDYLTALNDSFLENYLKSSLNDLPKLVEFRKVFGQAGLRHLKDTLKDKGFTEVIATYSPARIQELGNKTLLGLDKLAALIEKFGIVGAVTRTEVTYVNKVRLEILNNMITDIGVDGIKRVEDKLTLDQIGFWAGELKKDTFEVVDTLTAEMLTILIPKVNLLPPIIQRVTRPIFLDLAVELEDDPLLKAMDLDPLKFKNLVTSFPVNKLAPVLNNLEVIKKYTYNSLADLFNNKGLHVDKLKLADLTLLLIEVTPVKVGELLTLSPDELGKLMKLFSNANGKDFGRLLDRPNAQLQGQINDTTNRFKLTTWTAQTNVPTFAKLISEWNLPNEVFEKYSYDFLKFFKGVGGDLFDHLTDGQVKNNKISGAHTPASFTPLVNSQHGWWQENVGAPNATYKKVRYGVGVGPARQILGTKTLILDIPPNYQGWKQKANEAIWESIRSRRFEPADLRWTGQDNSGLWFGGIYNKSKPNAVATWFPEL